MGDRSLYVICVAKTSQLIISNYWGMDDTVNPFRVLHPNIIHDLIKNICRIHLGRFIKSSSLRLLLTSGRVTDFKLHNLHLEHRDAEEIFRALQTGCKNLKSIQIWNVFLKDSSKDLGRLLRSAKSLVSMETSIGFERNNLYYCDNLQKLILSYSFDDSSNSEVHTKPRYNTSLRVLKILNPQTQRNLYREIADILQYCVKIVEIDYDVAESLEFLRQMNRLARYKLQKTILGSYRGYGAKRATERAVNIAASTCPDLRNVEVSPDSYDSIYCLRHFHKIKVLTLYEPNCYNNDYRYGVQPLLEVPHFGRSLTSLTLKHFSSVDFTTIGICCPNLEDLKVEFFSECNSSNVTPKLFQKLIHLTLVNLHNEACTDFILRTLLFNSPELVYLKLGTAAMLTDGVLDEILENDGIFSNLKCINMRELGLTLKGLTKLATRLVSIKYIYASSRYISNEDAQKVFEESNLTDLIWFEMVQN